MGVALQIQREIKQGSESDAGPGRSRLKSRVDANADSILFI